MDQLAKAKKVLVTRIHSASVTMVPGLKSDLQAIHDGFEDIERQIGLLAGFLAHLAQRGAQSDLGVMAVHIAELQCIASMSDLARARLAEVLELKRRGMA